MAEPPLHPLPPAVAESARRVREAEVPPELERRIERALDAAERRERGRRAAPWSSFAVVLPALVPLVVLLLVFLRDGVPDPSSLARNEEHRIELGEDGHAWVELDLWTHHHDEPVTVLLEAPSSVDVATTSGSSRACDDRRCTHAFVAAPAPRPRVRVRVSQPGVHAIAVSHASPSRSVREDFVIHAQ